MKLSLPTIVDKHNDVLGVGVSAHCIGQLWYVLHTIWKKLSKCSTEPQFLDCGELSITWVPGQRIKAISKQATLLQGFSTECLLNQNLMVLTLSVLEDFWAPVREKVSSPTILWSLLAAIEQLGSTSNNNRRYNSLLFCVQKLDSSLVVWLIQR